jgi:hypothetical protein
MATTHGADVEYFPPTHAHAESQEQALARIVRAAHLDDRPEPLEADLTTLTGGNRRIAARAGLMMVLGAVAGGAIGLGLSRSSGPFGVESTGGTVGYMLVLGLALAVIVGLVSTLLMLEREDGRVEREVEEYQAHHHESTPL